MFLRAAFALNQIIGIGIGFSTPAGCAIIAVTASFGITVVTYYLLIYFFGITTLFGIDLILLAAIIPIKSYSNAEADKATILKDNKNKSGIYMWKNIINGKQYIGSAVDLSERLSFYFSKKALENYLKIVKV